MEKRIRIVWILSLISALLVIGVQGYWLYNQYMYVVNTYAGELAREVFNAGDEEYKIRKSNININYTLVINKDTEYSHLGKDSITEKDHMSFAMTQKRIIDASSNPGASNKLTIDSLRRLAKNITMQTLDSIKNNSGNLNNLPSDSMHLNLSMNKKTSQDSIQIGISRAIANQHNPFRAGLLDSILRADMPNMKFAINPWPQQDTIHSPRWQLDGNLLQPRLNVMYPYSPFEQKGVVIAAAIPAQPLFKRMAMQLLLASSLILLLIGCLVFQIKTILKQRKIGELRQNFVNTMIHELKRPVQTLKTFVAFLGAKEMRADEEMTEQVVQDSMFELDNLSAYLNKLKDMMRADDPETPLNLVRFNLQNLTGKVVRLTHIPAGKQVEFSTYFDMESPFIEADPIHLANVLSNLIENAIKYSGNTVQIEIKAKRKGRELWLTVSDNGVGIPLVEQDKVFAKFYRGSNLPDSNIPGLGLSYVKLISEAHQGYVSLQSSIGQGTSITLHIPQ